MASGLYCTGLSELQNGVIDADSNTLKLMLVTDDYTYNPDHDVIDNGANDGSDPSFCELAVDNYVGGHGGAGRKTVAVTVEVDKTNNRVNFIFADPTWPALGGVVNDIVHGAILVKENANDAAGRLIAFFDITDFTTNGCDVTFDFAAAGTGNIQIPVA